MTLEEIRRRQADIFEKIIVSLGKDRGIDPAMLGEAGLAAFQATAHLLLQYRAARTLVSVDIILMIDAWLELDLVARIQAIGDGSRTV